MAVIYQHWKEEIKASLHVLTPGVRNRTFNEACKRRGRAFLENLHTCSCTGQSPCERYLTVWERGPKRFSTNASFGILHEKPQFNRTCSLFDPHLLIWYAKNSGELDAGHRSVVLHNRRMILQYTVSLINELPSRLWSYRRCVRERYVKKKGGREVCVS